MNTQHQRKGKQKIIDPKLQNSFLIRGFLLSAGSLLSFAALIFWQLRAGLSSFVSSDDFMSKVQSIKQVNTFMLTVFTGRIWILAVIMLAVSIVITYFILTFFSHRIAGPMINFRNVLKKSIDGDKSVRIQLREGDFFKDLADDVNKLLEKH